MGSFLALYIIFTRGFVDKNKLFDDNQPVELKQLIAIIKSRQKSLFITSLVVSLVLYFVTSQLPPSYKASATIFVRRDAEAGSSSFFSYDGYYSIQTAEKYTDTVFGLLKSIDIRKLALERVDIPQTTKELGRLEKSVLVKRVGPQAVSLTVSSKNRQYAGSVFKSMVESLITRSQEINKLGDKRLSITLVEEEPIITETTVPPFLVAISGFILCFSGMTFGFVVRKYLL